jgi:hypothetical protein
MSTVTLCYRGNKGRGGAERREGVAEMREEVERRCRCREGVGNREGVKEV